MRKRALAVVINSGRAEHWLTNKERVHTSPPVAVYARSYYKNKVVCVDIFQQEKRKYQPKS